jgi:transcriptional regulator with XRE-family HTH domain
MKQLRNQVGLSQRELAQISGVSNAEISRIETGIRKRTAAATLRALAPYLCISYEELLKKAGYIDEVISPHSPTKIIKRDEDGNLIDVVERIKNIREV